jgi:hypothetical protein
MIIDKIDTSSLSMSQAAASSMKATMERNKPFSFVSDGNFQVGPKAVAEGDWV